MTIRERCMDTQVARCYTRNDHPLRSSLGPIAMAIAPITSPVITRTVSVIHPAIHSPFKEEDKANEGGKGCATRERLRRATLRRATLRFVVQQIVARVWQIVA